MDNKLQSSWKDGSKPFDGLVLSLTEDIDISLLRAALVDVVVFLRKRFQSALLKTFDDWHEHDGFITENRDFSWKQFDQLLSNNNALYNSRAGDTYVRRAFYPESKDFLLRYYLLDENEDSALPGIWGDFNIVLCSDIMDELSSNLPQAIADKFEIATAKRYFDNCYAG